ncbi:drug/metabolite transporter (DMT)-like permease [Arthrobacter silviterrae]|uniref:DMT family transporter n=1 Tax=Arthrobacter silviterrae TaxID=2026658 RepID=A0ABX0DD46_9MICC|nr:DMT family transporter [Arthrobacter silviterrae]MDQ0278263.1 drug/metabolite transporter (DMT)-like permease [Arthrobacter silviterrae]NGN84526.1 DMT family transporter [Arthrobacter silviterrae]
MILFLAVLGIVGVSASGPIMAATAAPALTIAFWRNALGALTMGAPVLVGGRGSIASLGRTELKFSAIAAIALALHFACFITSVKLTSVAAATALVCLQAAWIALFQWLRGRRPPFLIVLGLGVALGGVVVITGFDVGVSGDALVGDLLALAGGALAAVYTLAGSRARKSMSTPLYSSICYGIASVVLLAMCLALGQPLIAIPPVAWLGIIAVTVAAQIMGHTIFNHLLATISPLVVSMMILLEIPGAALLAGIFLGEMLPAGTYLGLALIIAGLAVVVLHQGRGGLKRTSTAG